jgi:hypothetical protein
MVNLKGFGSSAVKIFERGFALASNKSSSKREKTTQFFPLQDRPPNIGLKARPPEASPGLSTDDSNN